MAGVADQDIPFLKAAEEIGDELPPILNPRAAGFLRFANDLRANKGTWFKIAAGTASGNDAASLKKDFPDYEFATRLRSDADPGTVAGPQNIRNKDLFARYMGDDWFLEKIKQKQAKKREALVAKPSTIPTPREVHREP